MPVCYNTLCLTKRTWRGVEWSGHLGLKATRDIPGIWVWEKIPALSATWYTRFFFKGGTLDVPEMTASGEAAFGAKLLEIPGVLRVEPHMTYLEVLWRREDGIGNQIHVMGLAILSSHFSWAETRCEEIQGEAELDHVRREEGLPDWAWRIGRS